MLHPEAIAFEAGLRFAGIYLFSFFPRETSELGQPIAAKFCMMLGTVFSFIIPVQNFGEPPPKILDDKNMQNLA